jgi:hypothetical protein
MNTREPTEKQKLLTDQRALLREIEELEYQLRLVKDELAVVTTRLNLRLVKNKAHSEE